MPTAAVKALRCVVVIRGMIKAPVVDVTVSPVPATERLPETVPLPVTLRLPLTSNPYGAWLEVETPRSGCTAERLILDLSSSVPAEEEPPRLRLLDIIISTDRRRRHVDSFRRQEHKPDPSLRSCGSTDTRPSRLRWSLSLLLKPPTQQR
jgi:hypothetical protein